VIVPPSETGISPLHEQKEQTMKKWPIMGMVVAAIAGGTPDVARAGDDGWAALGGFLGGALLTEMFHHAGGSRAAVVYHHEAPHHHVAKRRGHYRQEYRNVWVPGHYEIRQRRCGGDYRVWIPGYYTQRKVEVWVQDGRHHRGHASYRHQRYARCR
jgi:hypothetical protein